MTAEISKEILDSYELIKKMLESNTQQLKDAYVQINSQNIQQEKLLASICDLTDLVQRLVTNKK